MNNIHKNFQQIEIPVVKTLYDLYVITHNLVSKFPKNERYSLGEKLENTLLETIEYVVFGNVQQKNFKDAYILKANTKIELLKLFWRLALDIKVIDDKAYLKVQQHLQESGKMLGGWLKYLQAN
jgi:hypothetical protein